jgi:hypothetical protein
MNILADPQETVVTVDGSTPAGALFISVKNVGAAVATFNGVPLAPGEAKSYSFIGKGYKSLVYAVNGSTLKIMTIF